MNCLKKKDQVLNCNLKLEWNKQSAHIEHSTYPNISIFLDLPPRKEGVKRREMPQVTREWARQMAGKRGRDDPGIRDVQKVGDFWGDKVQAVEGNHEKSVARSWLD